MSSMMVYALAVSPTLGSSGPTHLFTKTDRTPVQKARGLTILPICEKLSPFGGLSRGGRGPGRKTWDRRSHHSFSQRNKGTGPLRKHCLLPFIPSCIGSPSVNWRDVAHR